MYDATRAGREAKGFNTLGEYLGEDLRIRASVDSQATVGHSHRAVLGQARLTETAGLRIQDALQRREFVLVNVHGEHSPADVITKPVLQDYIVGHLARLGSQAGLADCPSEGRGPRGDSHAHAQLWHPCLHCPCIMSESGMRYVARHAERRRMAQCRIVGNIACRVCMLACVSMSVSLRL